VSIEVRAFLSLLPGLRESVDTWKVFALPQAGSHYWHDDAGYYVESVETVVGMPEINLIRDVEWEIAVLSPLPDGYSVRGGRDPDDGRWHFQVRDSSSNVVGQFLVTGPGLESTLRAAIEQATRRIGAPLDSRERPSIEKESTI
jgi:hypothetical protein